MYDLTRAHWMAIDCIHAYGSLEVADKELKLVHHVDEVPHHPRVNQCWKSENRLWVPDLKLNGETTRNEKREWIPSVRVWWFHHPWASSWCVRTYTPHRTEADDVTGLMAVEAVVPIFSSASHQHSVGCMAASWVQPVWRSRSAEIVGEEWGACILSCQDGWWDWWGMRDIL